MTTKEILNVAKNSTWTNVNSIIENSNLEINLIQNLPYMKMWEVKNNKEITHVTNSMKYLGKNIAEVTFCFNY